MSQDIQLTELVRRAAAIAAAAPEGLREAAFQRAFDALFQAQVRRAPAAEANGPDRDTNEVSQDVVQQLLQLDRSKASDVDHVDGGVGKALALLRAAERELGVDGLSAPQIAKVLTEKFRWRVTRQAVRQALDAAGRLVDAVPGPRGARVYRLMAAGEKWLDSQPKERKASTIPPTTRTRARRRRDRGDRATTADSGEPTRVPELAPQTAKATKDRKPSHRIGPKGAVESLIESGWFAEGRTLEMLRTELQQQRALIYKATDLSPALVRLLREGRLRRNRNSDGQYEYLSADS